MVVNTTHLTNKWELVKKRVMEKWKPRAVREGTDALVIEASNGSTYVKITRKVKSDSNPKKCSLN